MKLPRRRWLILIVIVAAGFALQQTIFRRPPVEVEVQTAAVGPVEDVVTNSEGGTVKSRSRAKLGVEAQGRVAVIRSREGAKVKRGEILLQLDATTDRTRLQAAERDREAQRAALESARAAANLARQTLERTEQLHTQGLVAQEQLDQARARRDGTEADVRAGAARLKSAETAVALARDALTHLEIRAPFDGVVAHRYVEVGEQVIPGQPLLELVSVSRIYVSAPIDERDAGRLREGLPVRITVDTYPGVVWDARVTRLAPVVEEAKEQNRTIEVEVDFPANPGRPEPSPGMTADLEIVLDRRDQVLRVPSFSIMEGKRVLVAEKGRAVSRDVEIGLRNWDWAEIRSGLSPGARVITSLDRPGLKSGVAIAIKERANAKGAG